MQRLVLIGYRGSGKTTIGRALARAANLPFYDTDRCIEAFRGCSVAEIFASEGEAGFRRREREAVASLPLTPSVVATGGGVVCDPENVRILREKSRIIFLTASPEALIQRQSRSPRPSLTGLPPEKEIPILLEKRLPFYLGAADECIDTERLSLDQICDHLLSHNAPGAKDQAMRRMALESLSQSPMAEGEFASLSRAVEGGKGCLFGVAGNPCGHSRSPAIFNRLFQESGLEFHYTRMDDPDIARIVRHAEALRLKGLSVTIPHKETVMQYCDVVDSHAEAIGAVNTVVFCGKRRYGFNTDWLGVRRPLEEMGPQDAVVIGAGGAAAAAVYALSSLGCDVTVLNRTEDAARRLAGRFGCKWAPLSPAAISEAGIIVHATPVGMGARGGSLASREMLHEGQVVFDLVYTPPKTILLKEAEAAGCTAISGVEMFVHQAAAQFSCFTGLSADPDHIREMM